IPMVILGAIVVSFFYADSFLEGLQFIFYATIGYLAFFSLLLLFDGQFLIKFKSRTDYVQVNRSPEELNKLELEYKDKLKEYNLNYESNERRHKVELEGYWSTINGNRSK